MKVSDLIGVELDYWVAVAEGFKITRAQVPWRLMLDKPGVPFYVLDIGKPEDERSAGDYKASSDWSIGGPIIERERISLSPVERGDGTPDGWIAYHGRFRWQGWPSHDCLTAAMRCFVASRFGPEVTHPPAER